MPRPAVSYSEAVAARICLRLAHGQGLKRICRAPGMPARRNVLRWQRQRPEFAARLAAARARGGLTGPGRPLSYSLAVAEAIFERVCAGESLTGVCRDPAMPALSTVYLWNRRVPAFAEALATARAIQFETLMQQGLAICEAVTPATAAAAGVQLAHLRWTIEAQTPRKYR